MEPLLTQVIGGQIENIPLTLVNVDVALEVPPTEIEEIIMVMTTITVKIGTVTDPIPSDWLQKRKTEMKTRTEPKHP